MTMDLIAFISARLDEDEQTARAATPAPWWYNPGKVWLGAEAFEAYDRSKGEEFVGYGESPFSGCIAATGPGDHPQSMRDAEHIARHAPARVLRDVEAKRRLLAYRSELEDKALDGNWWNLDTELPLKLLALPYADHPDYREEWRP